MTSREAGSLSTFTGGTAKALTLAAILVLAVAIRLYCFHGYWGTDDGEYARLANAMAKGQFSAFVNENYIQHAYAPAHLPYRIALIAPLALLFKLFGVSETVLVAYPMAVSVLGVLLAFVCGRLLFGPQVGLVAAALWSVLPEDVSLASLFLPDAIASFYASLGVLIVLFLNNRETERSSFRFAGGLAAGLLFGISWLSKESIFYLVPFCAVLLVASAWLDVKRALPLWSGVAIGSLAVITAEMTVYAMSRGDFMLRMHENERSFMQTKSYLFYEGSRFGWPVGASHLKALFKRLFLDGPGVIFLNVQFLFLPFFGLIAAAYGLYKKDRSFAVPGLWMLTLVLAYNFMSCSFASYTPLVLLERYLHPILLPATVLTAGLLVKVLQRPEGALDYAVYRERLFWGSLVASLVFAISAYSAFRQVRDIRDLRAILEIRQLARTIGPNETVYTDPLSGKAFEFFWKFPETTGLTNFEGMRHEQVASSSYVLVDKYRLDWLNVNVGMWLTKDYGYHAPEFATGAPDGWKRRWRDDNATLYRVE